MIRQRLLASSLAIAFAFAPLSANAQLFGPSDEEKAHEAAQDSAIHDLQGGAQAQDSRIRELEDKVRGLTGSLSQATGTNEELQHQVQIQNDKIDRMQKDFAYRLCQLSAQQLGAGDQMNCAAAGTPSANAPAGNMGGQAYVPPPGGMRAGDALPPMGNAPQGGGQQVTSEFDNPAPVRGRPPGNLGTLSMGSGPNPPPMQGGATNTAQYDQAMNLLSRAQYNEAAAAFRSYADNNPQDTANAPQAIYWVANIAFIQQDYSSAARTFAEVIKKYPKSLRAPDAMLKLAQSFMAMGQKSEGCTTLGLIKTKYPDAASQTLNQAASLKKTACSK
jgi:tol-pal system protein YbgF